MMLQGRRSRTGNTPTCGRSTTWTVATARGSRRFCYGSLLGSYVCDLEENLGDM
ncbi:hypothetical protein HMPREF9578_00901 [Cutibacterium acnes HL110PA4]|nr:hypothetical protein HMPREF9603_01931 [Cutibacterium acnes HL001PA1]EFT09917.1 hypothetical protein HMPREF9619_01773 [Cutibacterium acnes HL082PA2]EFT63242.1 hypothetical protein HMPREF9578_00901 [Cutibacterium acnes HL110PA4]EGE70755.1 hypothetical protein HMPREF9341_00466 [Cutibacterium acnes HL103PA1]